MRYIRCLSIKSPNTVLPQDGWGIRYAKLVNTKMKLKTIFMLQQNKTNEKEWSQTMIQ